MLNQTMKIFRCKCSKIKHLRCGDVIDASGRQQTRLASTHQSDQDKLVRSVSAGGGVSVKCVVATNLVRAATLSHGCGSAAALGRAIMGNILIASGSKSSETVQLEIKGGGPIGMIRTEAGIESGGILSARGYVTVPHLVGTTGNDDVGTVVGKTGCIRVSRSHPLWKAPYVGTTSLVTGGIAEDLAHHISCSEQILSTVGLGIFLESGKVTAAAGFICSRLPNCSDFELNTLEKNMSTLATPSEFIRNGFSVDDMTSEILFGLGERVRVHEAIELRCKCNRMHILRSFKYLGYAELKDMLEKREGSSVVCDWCGKNHIFSTEDLRCVFDAEFQPSGAAT